MGNPEIRVIDDVKRQELRGNPELSLMSFEKIVGQVSERLIHLYHADIVQW